MGIFKKKEKRPDVDITWMKSGTLIEISKLSDDRHTHISKLEEFKDNNELIILAPISKGSVVRLPQNTKYNIMFKTKKGLFKNTINIEEYIIKDGLTFIRAKLISETEKIQRRTCFRLESFIDINFDIVEDTSDEIFYEDEPLLSTGVTVDISNGGLKFFSNEQLEEGDLIKMSFLLNESLLYAIGYILFTENVINNKYKYCYKLKFKRIDTKDKEYISRYIFDQQRELSKTARLKD